LIKFLYFLIPWNQMHSFSSIVIILFSNLLMIIIIIIFYFTLQINSMLFLFILIIIFFKFINYFINYNKNDNINNTNNDIFNINNINYNKNNNISYTKNNIFNIYNTMILGPATQLDPISVVWQGSQTQPFLKCCWVWWIRRDPGTQSCKPQAPGFAKHRRAVQA